MSSPTASCRAAHSIKVLQNGALAPNVSCLFVMYTACQMLDKKLLYLHGFQHPQSPVLLGLRSNSCWVIRLSSRETLKVPPWTPHCSLHRVSLKFCQLKAAALTPGAPLYDQPCAHRWHACLSHPSPSLSLQSTKENTELSVHKHPREEEPHVADATALLNASFKAFWGLYRRDE